jgi:hypothetical protein
MSKQKNASAAQAVLADLQKNELKLKKELEELER